MHVEDRVDRGKPDLRHGIFGPIRRNREPFCIKADADTRGQPPTCHTPSDHPDGRYIGRPIPRETGMVSKRHLSPATGKTAEIVTGPAEAGHPGVVEGVLQRLRFLRAPPSPGFPLDAANERYGASVPFRGQVAFVTHLGQAGIQHRAGTLAVAPFRPTPAIPASAGMTIRGLSVPFRGLKWPFDAPWTKRESRPGGEP